MYLLALVVVTIGVAILFLLYQLLALIKEIFRDRARQAGTRDLEANQSPPIGPKNQVAVKIEDKNVKEKDKGTKKSDESNPTQTSQNGGMCSAWKPSILSD